MIFALKEPDLGHVTAEYSFYLGGWTYCMTIPGLPFSS